MGHGSGHGKYPDNWIFRDSVMAWPITKIAKAICEWALGPYGPGPLRFGVENSKNRHPGKYDLRFGQIWSDLVRFCQILSDFVRFGPYGTLAHI